MPGDFSLSPPREAARPFPGESWRRVPGTLVAPVPAERETMLVLGADGWGSTLPDPDAADVNMFLH